MDEKDLNMLRNKVAFAISICKENPYYAISGSIALMLCGHIKPRRTHDIDLVTYCDQANIDGYRTSNIFEYGDSGEGDIFDYSITSGNTSLINIKTTAGLACLPVRHDLFLMSKHNETMVLNCGVRVHRPDRIWEAKDNIGGIKHRIDSEQRGTFPFPSEIMPKRKLLWWR